MQLLEVLEFNKIREEVTSYASTKIGGEVLSNLKPVTDYSYVKESLKEVTAARELLQEFGIAPFGGIRDLRQILKKVEKGVVLSAKELVSTLNTLGGIRALRSYFKEIVGNLDPRLIEERLDIITDEGLKLVVLSQLERELDRCLDDYGEIQDRASRKLAGLRAEMENLSNRIRDKMDAVVKNSKYKSMLQDALVTKRGDRYVVPVKHEYRNVFDGIVHDQSSSGLTLFMEPLAIVRMNNRLRELQREEEKEIYRILSNLTELVADNIWELRENLKLVTFLDAAYARAGYSTAIGGIAPELNNKGIVKIESGRHPLLRDEAVPIDINVGDNFRTLVITGPNTGGKTVAIKTLGLFVLMTEAGLHIPAERGTDIAVFEKVFADIGDEQSIEQNLSTFSSHINRIKSFLEVADENSLVLLDELGAGTDPREGAALGISILEELRSRRVVTVATTHYSQLKSYAYSQSGVENASVEFDLKTLRPTYRLQMGIPGGSNAFAIALRLGIPGEIIEQAQNLLSGEELEVENIISGLNEELKKYRQINEDLKEQKKEADRIKAEYQSRLNDFEQRREKTLKEARAKAAELIKETRKETRELIQKLKNMDFSSRSEVDRWATKANENFKSLDDSLIEEREEDEQTGDIKLKLGDQVRLKRGGTRGEVVEIDEDKDEVTIQAGIITLKASIDDLIRAEMPDEKKDEMVKRYRVKKTQKVSPRFDLRGERFEAAQHRLDKYLDDVFLAGLKQVEIIHGKGTGALREAVSDLLSNHPHVDNFRLGRDEEGGSGVTVVSIK